MHYPLSKTDESLIYTKALKFYAIISFANIPGLKSCFVIGDSSTCCCLISFWQYWHLILEISVLREFKHRLTTNNGSGKNRKNICLGSIEMTKEYCLALTGIRVFSENAYISSFLQERQRKMLENLLGDFWNFESAWKR